MYTFFISTITNTSVRQRVRRDRSSNNKDQNRESSQVPSTLIHGLRMERKDLCLYIQGVSRSASVRVFREVIRFR